MSQFNATTYEVAKPTGVCAATGRALEPGETYFAALADVPEDQIERDADGKPKDEQALGLKRFDVCEAAWRDGYRPEGMFSYWKSTVPEPNEKKKLFVDDAVLMNLLNRLADAEQPQRLAFRYVLALILMRKKLLRYDGAETRTAEVEVDGEKQTVEQVWWKLTPKVDVTKGHFGKWNEEVTIELLDPKLDEASIEQVAGQLNQIFEAEL
jgi:hypothetical protein